jgi:predicted component of type VI protein secretion system
MIRVKNKTSYKMSKNAIKITISSIFQISPLKIANLIKKLKTFLSNQLKSNKIHSKMINKVLINFHNKIKKTFNKVNQQ